MCQHWNRALPGQHFPSNRRSDRLAAVDRARVALAALGLLALSGWLAWMPRLDTEASTPGKPTAPALPPPPLDSSPPGDGVEGAQVEREQEACLIPTSAARGRLSLEPPSLDHWQEAAAAGHQLAEDPCGNIWALWFNSWAVFPHGDPEQSAPFRIVGGETMRKLSMSGVADFVPLGKQLWVLGNNGALARFDASGWQII